MSNFPIFSVLGIEIEYMLVDKETLNVQPKSDVILSALAGGRLANEVVLGDIALSNELVMHVVEFKNNGPKPANAPIALQFQQALADIQPLLEQNNLLLLPSGAHPWMNPDTETVRWPHDNHDIYNQYDAIFNCRGHGWANLQSMHVNLPYSNSEEFCQLHNLIRLILPLLPALAASSPCLDGKMTQMASSRLHYYSQNQQKIPSISGDIIPEFIRSEAQYQEEILNPMYRDIRPYDPQAILQHEWLNSRAAIPKFEQKAIEIRILDSQECVNADIAIAKVIHAVLKHWHHHSPYLQQMVDTKQLKAIYDRTIQSGLDVEVSDLGLFKQWCLPLKTATARQIWSKLIETVRLDLTQTEQEALELIIRQGNLSARIQAAAAGDMHHSTLKRIYAQLTHCLRSNQQFTP